jgi:hypothetical protein
VRVLIPFAAALEQLQQGTSQSSPVSRRDQKCARIILDCLD